MTLVYHKCTTTQGAAQAESWSCTSFNPLQHSSPHSSMRHCLVERRNGQQVLDCWDGNLKQPSAAAHLTAGWAVGRQQSADTHYLQWTAGVSCTMWLILNRIRESISFPWLTTIISCEESEDSEITALHLSRTSFSPQLQAEIYWAISEVASSLLWINPTSLL